MSYVKVPDASGTTMVLAEVDGRRYTPFALDAIQNAHHMKLRDDDVMLCSYPKSGTHWSHEICRLLLNGTIDIQVIRKGDFMVEKFSEEEIEKYPSPRIINSHLRFDRLPADVLKKKLKIVYIRRNPKDVAVSFYNHTRKLPIFQYEGEFKDFLSLYVAGGSGYGSWFDYVLEWEKVIATNTELSILGLTYEDLKEDPIKEIRKVSDFLGLKRNDKFFSQIKDICNFDTMQERFKWSFGHVPDEYKIFFRKGEVGDWKNWFTVEQNEWFDEIYKQKMAKSKLEVKFTLDQ